MQLWRYLWLLVLGSALAAGVWACTGSGSSGFDAFPRSENAAIEQALNEQRCVEREGLTICPADESAALPVATPTPTPTGTPNSVVDTPAPQHTPPAGVTASPTGTPAAAPRTATATPPMPRTPRVDTGIDATGPLACTLSPADQSCLFLIPFAPDGFPDGTVFRVAVRTLEPESVWAIGPDLSFTGVPDTPVFDAPVAVATAAQAPQESIVVQLAVLAFPAVPADVPAEVDELGQTGASFAFVTPQLILAPQATP